MHAADATCMFNLYEATPGQVSVAKQACDVHRRLVFSKQAMYAELG